MPDTVFPSDQCWTVEPFPSPFMILKVWDQRLISKSFSATLGCVSVTEFPSFGFALTFGSCWLKILKGKIYSILFSLRELIKVSCSGRAYITLLSSAFQDIRRATFLQSLGPEWRCAISLKGPIENSPDVICNRLWRDSSKVWRIWVPLSHPAGG